MKLIVWAGDIEPHIEDYFELEVEILNTNDEAPEWVSQDSVIYVEENSYASECEEWGSGVGWGGGVCTK